MLAHPDGASGRPARVLFSLYLGTLLMRAVGAALARVSVESVESVEHVAPAAYRIHEVDEGTQPA